MSNRRKLETMKKIPTIFKRNPDNRKELLNEATEECLWVFQGEGIATRKYDGTCCKIDESGFWKRREVKPGKPVPVDFVEEHHDTITGKKVGWIPVTGGEEDKWHVEAIAYSRKVGESYFGTFELCGPKVQGNPEELDMHRLIKHEDAEVFEIQDRSFKGLFEFLKDRDIEGIVFHHPDGRKAKIKKRDFGLKRLAK